MSCVSDSPKFAAITSSVSGRVLSYRGVVHAEVTVHRDMYASTIASRGVANDA